MKRQEYISWDEYFVSVAILSGFRSKDPATQVGACIVNERNKIIGVGYNGFPNGCHDDSLPWSKDGDWLDTKHPYVCHAELNAILNASTSVQDCRIYVGLFPCNECAKTIIQSGIVEVIYLNPIDMSKDYVKAARIMFDMAGIKYRQFTPMLGLKSLTIDLGDTNV